jgi:hypothetical protein
MYWRAATPRCSIRAALRHCSCITLISSLVEASLLKWQRQESPTQQLQQVSVHRIPPAVTTWRRHQPSQSTKSPLTTQPHKYSTADIDCRACRWPFCLRHENQRLSSLNMQHTSLLGWSLFSPGIEYRIRKNTSVSRLYPGVINSPDTTRYPNYSDGYVSLLQYSENHVILYKCTGFV